jgi:NAD(P)H dehydrogenase (quinone)
MKLGITGASGQLGTFLVRHALARTAASNLVAITRNPGRLEEFAKQGVETRAGDFAQPAGLAEAFRGIDRLVIIPTTDLTPGVRIGQHSAAIDSAVKAGVKHILYISAISPRPDPANVLLESHFLTEQKLLASGAQWTLLRMGVYMESIGDAAKRAVAAGAYSAIPGEPMAYVRREDIAAAAAGILTSDGHAGITYHATGVASVSQPEIAEIIAKVTGKPIGFAPMTEAQQRAGLEAAGLPPTVINGIIGFGAAGRAGAFDLVTGDVRRLSGKAAGTVEDYLRETLK